MRVGDTSPWPSMATGAVAEESGVDGYTKDGTVDLKGNPVRRSHRGGWSACFFIVGKLIKTISLILVLSLIKMD